MQLTTALSAVLAASPLASATVFLGIRTGSDGHKSQVAYTNGTPDICSGFTTIRNDDGNPCGIRFSVDGITGFQFEGCGGSNFHLEKDGKFNSNCKYTGKNYKCPGGVGIKEDWLCA